MTTLFSRRYIGLVSASLAAVSMSRVVKSSKSLGFPFSTPDPWLFAVYHKDDFPAGDEAMRVPGGKRGNGADFELNERKRWRFYHGDRIPGFPMHPHKGFGE